VILEAAAAADTKDAPLPQELVTQWRMERYGALPRAGGLDDQPAGLIQRAETAAVVYSAMRNAARLSAKEFQRNASEYRAWQMVLSLRRERSAIGDL